MLPSGIPRLLGRGVTSLNATWCGLDICNITYRLFLNENDNDGGDIRMKMTMTAVIVDNDGGDSNDELVLHGCTLNPCGHIHTCRRTVRYRHRDCMQASPHMRSPKSTVSVKASSLHQRSHGVSSGPCVRSDQSESESRTICSI